MTLLDAQQGKEYVVEKVNTQDQELNAFLFSLGLYSGEIVTVVSRRKKTLVVSIKDARYSIDSLIAEAIEIF